MEKEIGMIIRCLTAETEAERQAIQGELRDLLRSDKAASKDMDAIIDRALLDLGVPCHVKGYCHLAAAIHKVVENPDLVNAITNELYPVIAEQFQTTPSRVEKAIRHAIECGWDRVDLEDAFRYFGNTISGTRGKPTNREFIARVAKVVRSRMECAA